MNKRNLLIAIPALCSGLPARTNPTRISNVIYILMDDLGYGDIGCFGQDKIETHPYRPFMQRRHQTDTTLFRFPRISSGTLRTDDRYALRSCANPLQQ